jgi:hypothetical protein
MTLLTKAGLLACALTLSACSTLQGQGGAETAAKVLGNLEHCSRDYTVVIGSLGIPGGSLNIKCPAKPYDSNLQQ